MVNTYTNYQVIARDIAKSIARVESQPMVKRETEYYLANIGKVKSIEEFLADDRLYRYAMKAFGLEEMTYAKGLIKKALTEGIDEADSFANKLTDKRYREFVETFNFARFDELATTFTRAQQGTVDKYLRQTLEENAGQQDEGVRLALYFQRKASSVTSYYNILADKALTQVVRTALGLPDSFASSPIDRQVETFKKRLKIEDLSDPTRVEKFLKRFTALWDANKAVMQAQTSVSVLFGQPAEAGISTDLLFQIQQLKR